jgi:polygalacturonase
MPELRILAQSARTVSILLAPNHVNFTQPEPVHWTLATATGGEVCDGFAESAGIFLENLEPDSSYEFSCSLGSLRFKTHPCAGLIEAVDFGADPESADNSVAFAKAIEAVPEGGTLRVPAGIYPTRPLFLKGNMTLLLEEGAVLAAIGDRTNWPILPARDDMNRVLGSWEGLPEPCYAAPVTAIDCDGLIITGRGTIDAGGDRGDWWEWPKSTRNGARRPRSVHLLYGLNVQLSGITIQNSPSWTLHPFQCDGLHVSNVHIINPHNSPNTDGLDPESCLNTEIIATHFTVGDDCIAIKAGKRADDGSADHLADTRGVLISHCRMERGHGAVVIGSEMSGNITDVTISHCEFDETDRGLRLKTRRGRGGEIGDIKMSDVTMQNVPTPLAINAFYFCDADGKSDWVQSRDPAPVNEGTPAIRDITCRNVTAFGVETAAAAILGLPEAPVKNVTINDFRVSYAPDAKPSVPLMALRVPAVRHAGVISKFAEVKGEIETLAEEKETTTC